MSKAQAQCGRNCCVCCVWQPEVFYGGFSVGEEIVLGGGVRCLSLGEMLGC